MRFKKDKIFDAQMVIAFRKNMIEPLAIQAGLKPDEIFGRKEWLPKQSRQYLHSVEMEVLRLQQEVIKNQLQ